ncbi:MAG: 16S rRNA (uracil(1498)-N(3))-methyltransferase [Micromonosporaceae bacterium]
MTLSLFTVASLPPEDTFRLDGPEGHHAATVQRLRVGEALLLGDGAGGLARCEVVAVSRGALDLVVRERSREPEPCPRVTVVQAIAKGDRGELAVQAMTEVGVDTVVPWSAARSVARWKADRGAKALERWRAVAREAAKQSRRAWFPAVAELASTAAVADLVGAATAAYVLHEEATAPLAGIDLPADGEIVLVVGPEGGIAPEELAAFVSAGARPVRLGSSVLRTSTAGVAALSVVNARTGRWG